MPTVTLRRVCAEDLPILFDFQSDPRWGAMAMVKPRPRAVFDEIWQKIAADPAARAWVILEGGLVAGSIGCHAAEGLTCVGYGLGAGFWGRGIASRALAELLERVGERPLHARVAATNAASIRVLERNGFIEAGRQWSPETERYIACEEVKFILPR